MPKPYLFTSSFTIGAVLQEAAEYIVLALQKVVGCRLPAGYTSRLLKQSMDKATIRTTAASIQTYLRGGFKCFIILFQMFVQLQYGSNVTASRRAREKKNVDTAENVTRALTYNNNLEQTTPLLWCF